MNSVINIHKYEYEYQLFLLRIFISSRMNVVGRAIFRRNFEDLFLGPKCSDMVVFAIQAKSSYT